ncbi:MAG: hypothetical protein KGZ74_19640 [Chitinophagaceae bacterium]|nr:hypothetical protein [Chitinophagaceae bacterium]
MRHLLHFSFFLFAVMIISCKKNPSQQPQPEPKTEMIYTPLNDVEIKYQSRGVLIDLNKDDRADVFFGVTHVGDPVNKEDKFRFNIITSILTSIPVNNNEQTPVFRKDVRIPLNNFGVYNWYNASEITLIEKIISENGSFLWIGNWLAANRNYLPVQILGINNQRFNGWIELTADASGERLILHRAAISKVPETEVSAGL